MNTHKQQFTPDSLSAFAFAIRPFLFDRTDIGQTCLFPPSPTSPSTLSSTLSSVSPPHTPRSSSPLCLPLPIPQNSTSTPPPLLPLQNPTLTPLRHTLLTTLTLRHRVLTSLIRGLERKPWVKDVEEEIYWYRAEMEEVEHKIKKAREGLGRDVQAERVKAKVEVGKGGGGLSGREKAYVEGKFKRRDSLVVNRECLEDELKQLGVESLDGESDGDDGELWDLSTELE